MASNTNHFDLIQSTQIPSLNIRYEEYQHKTTKAKHIHLATDNDENVFLVGLRTVPTDSTGVAHILEHTSLCGSERYPVRDPFFMMIRRSLNTFMNAFTSSDWTAYPFASKNKKDFNNLLDVYLDAVFFARLDPLDFAQEGHRIEFAEADNPNSELVYKGVVFNEMKGAMSSTSSQLWQAVGENLFPNTTYGVNSGGEPADIPKLSYQQLLEFYQTHYHPDNAIFMTFGDIPANEHQKKFEQLVLKRFSSTNHTIEVKEQKAFSAPQHAHSFYPLAKEEDIQHKTHHVMAWKLEKITDPLTLMTAHLLSNVLLENSAAPLQKALETTKLGNAPSPLCGLDDSGLEMIFICGIQGSEVDQQADFEKLVINTLESIVENGIDQDRLTALLDQLELQQREISGDSYPYGLQLMLSCLASAIHRGNPAKALDLDPILLTLREQITNPDFIKNTIRAQLLDNPHRITLTMQPDQALADKRLSEEAKILAAIKEKMDATEIQKTIETASALNLRQLEEDDPEILPKVTLSDIPEKIDEPTYTSNNTVNTKTTFYPQGTNGIVYFQSIASLPTLNNHEVTTLSLHNRLLTEVGVGEKNYLQTQDWQSKVCGSIHAYSSIKGTVDDPQQVNGHYILSSKGLKNHATSINELMSATFYDARFDEQTRIKDLISQSRTRAEQAVTNNGHSLAMSVACQGYSPTANLNFHTAGMAGIQTLKNLDDKLKEPQAIDTLCNDLQQLHDKLKSCPKEFLFIGEKEQAHLLDDSLQQWASGTNAKLESSTFSLPPTSQQTRELWLCNTQVNFCAKAYPTVPAAHPDAPVLSVLAGLLRNNFLHTAIREQGGAYGGGASQDSSIGAFRFYSYRDPRLTETLNDFDRSIDWVINHKISSRQIEEAILGVISAIDKPLSPAGTAKNHFHNELSGKTIQHQTAFRNGVLKVNSESLKRVAETYLKPDTASFGVITHSGEEKQYSPLCSENAIRIQQL